MYVAFITGDNAAHPCTCVYICHKIIFGRSLRNRNILKRKIMTRMFCEREKMRIMVCCIEVLHVIVLFCAMCAFVELVHRTCFSCYFVTPYLFQCSAVQEHTCKSQVSLLPTRKVF